MAAAQAIQVRQVELPATYDEGSMTKDTPPPQKLGGVFFWMTAGLALLKDVVVDPAVVAGDAMGWAMTASVIGAPIGIAIVVVCFAMGAIFSVTVWLIIHAYYLTHGGVHASAKLKRLVLWLFTILVGMIPFMKLLPETTFIFFAVAWLENAIRQNNLVAHTLRYGVDRFAK